MFDLSSLQYNSEHPTFLSILITVLYALVLGIMIAFTYEKTSRNIARPDQFIQAMVLITIVAATIMQAIGDSVARGLGMLGALSIIRFRTSVQNPRNVVFIFSALAAGIACGVFGFVVAIVGTLGFCLTAFLLRFSSFSREYDLIGKLRIEVPTGYARMPELEEQLGPYCKRLVPLGSKLVIPLGDEPAVMAYDYRFTLQPKCTENHILQAVRDFPEATVSALSFSNNPGFEV